MPTDRPRVLLLWPGSLGGTGGNFGVPQLLTIASAIRKREGAIVDVVDLDLERGLGPIDLERIASVHYDLVGISCYSSFDYLKVMALATRLRQLLPRAWFATGGYHPSARPDDFTTPESPFDFVIVGDGENPMARLAEAIVTGKRPLMRVLGPDAVPEPSEVMPYDWSLLSRYLPVARRVASQAEIYLSRGCPYDCAFCMERAKRDTSWRALTPEEAVEEMHRLDAFLDLSTWTLFIADALFGMKQAWRRTFLEALARRPVRAKRVWLLIRVDLIEREDLVLMSRANVSPGFGLESGDPDHLRRIRKAGKLHDYLDKMIAVSEWARDLDVPFGANVIVGHPGETEASLRTSERYLKRLFCGNSRGTHGFLSVDPFRLYPGSPIDEERATWERDTGMRLHRYPWWYDGDQDFLSEWVDPSSDLDYRRTQRLRHELFDPILCDIAKRFAHTGPSRDYFMRSVREQLEQIHPRARLRRLGAHGLWTRLNAGGMDPLHDRAEDSDLAEQARLARKQILAERKIPDPFAALERVPRESFVPIEHVGASADDTALPLQSHGKSTISALHAYATNYAALDLGPGDRLLELGTGTGYGAALAAEIVGPAGGVVSIEIDPDLAGTATRLLAPWPKASVSRGDAHDTALWPEANKICCTFALTAIPEAWVDRIPLSGRLIAPLSRGNGEQDLVLIERTATGIVKNEISSVRYVRDRSPRARSVSKGRSQSDQTLRIAEGSGGRSPTAAASPK